MKKKFISILAYVSVVVLSAIPIREIFITTYLVYQSVLTAITYVTLVFIFYLLLFLGGSKLIKLPPEKHFKWTIILFRYFIYFWIITPNFINGKRDMILINEASFLWTYQLAGNIGILALTEWLIYWIFKIKDMNN